MRENVGNLQMELTTMNEQIKRETRQVHIEINVKPEKL